MYLYPFNNCDLLVFVQSEWHFPGLAAVAPHSEQPSGPSLWKSIIISLSAAAGTGTHAGEKAAEAAGA